MNKSNLKKLIKVMKEKKYGFVMREMLVRGCDIKRAMLYGRMTEEEANICGAAGCIAGHCYLICDKDGEYSLTRMGEDFLGLSYRQTVRLFMPDNQYASCKVSKKSKRFVTRQRAIKVLENLLETGEVDWSVT